MKKSELRRIIKEEIKKINPNIRESNIHDPRSSGNFDHFSPDPIGDGGGFSPREIEFTRNIPARINQFVDKLDDLIDEYHAELYLKDGVFTGMEAVKIAALGPDTAEDNKS